MAWSFSFISILLSASQGLTENSRDAQVKGVLGGEGRKKTNRTEKRGNRIFDKLNINR